MAASEEGGVFTCTICLEKFVNPKYLSCLHTFCESCITSFISSAISDCEIQKRSVCFYCPVCRRKNKPPLQNISAEEWAKRLPKNYQLQSIADSLAKQRISEHVFCESCRNNNEDSIATLRCKQCQNNLCETCCTFIHQRVKGFNLHSIVDLKKSQFRNDSIGEQGFCVEHPEKELIVYCSNHETLCCTFCLTAKHSNCNHLVSLDEIAEMDVKLSTGILYRQTQEIREISKMAIPIIKENINSLNLKKEQILSNAAENIRYIKERLDASFFQLQTSLNNTHEDTVSKLTMILKNFESFDETLFQAERVTSAVVHDGSRKQMFIVLTKLHRLISEQWKGLTAQRKHMKIAQLNWDGVDTQKTLTDLTKLLDFEYLHQPVDWIAQIDRHYRVINYDANPKEIVFGEMTMKEIIPKRIVPELCTDFSKCRTALSDDKLVMVAFFIGCTRWTWRFSLISEQISVWEKVWRNHRTSNVFCSIPPAILLNPNETLKAFGLEAQDQYSELQQENEHWDYYFFENITSLLESGKCLNEHTQLTDISGKGISAMKVFRLALQFIVRDFNNDLEKHTTLFHTSNIKRNVMVLPSRWNEKTQLFLKEAAVEAGMQVHAVVLEAELAFFCFQHLIKKEASEENNSLFWGKTYLIAEFGDDILSLTVHIKHGGTCVDKILKIGVMSFGLNTFVDEFESCIKDITGKEVMQEMKTRDSSSYRNMMESCIKCLHGHSKDSKTRVYLPITLTEMYDDYTSPSSFQEAIDMSVHAGKLHILKDKMIWNKKDFQELFDKPVRRIIRVLEKVTRDMEDIETIVMCGYLAECPLIQNAVRKSFSEKHPVVLTAEQIQNVAVYV